MTATLRDLSVAIDNIEGGKPNGLTASSASELLDVARAARMTLSHAVILAFERALDAEAPKGWKVSILYDGSRLRFAWSLVGQISSLEADTPLLGTSL